MTTSRYRAPLVRALPVLTLFVFVPASTSSATRSAGDEPPGASIPLPSAPEPEWTGVEIGSLDRGVLELALDAAACAVRAGSVRDPGTLTVIDYSRPSSEKRLWVFDLRQRRLLFEELVAHGQGSGGDLATSFSNTSGSHQSSLGLFVTDETYVGRNGYSLRLDGLDDGYNDRARERAIVMHGAPYVSDDFVRSAGRLGRSWGCPAVRTGITRDLLDVVKGGNLVFAYYPDREWLRESRYLGDCAAAASAALVTP